MARVITNVSSVRFKAGASAVQIDCNALVLTESLGLQADDPVRHLVVGYNFSPLGHVFRIALGCHHLAYKLSPIIFENGLLRGRADSIRFDDTTEFNMLWGDSPDGLDIADAPGDSWQSLIEEKTVQHHGPPNCIVPAVVRREKALKFLRRH